MNIRHARHTSQVVPILSLDDVGVPGWGDYILYSRELTSSPNGESGVTMQNAGACTFEADGMRCSAANAGFYVDLNALGTRASEWVARSSSEGQISFEIEKKWFHDNTQQAITDGGPGLGGSGEITQDKLTYGSITPSNGPTEQVTGGTSGAAFSLTPASASSNGIQYDSLETNNNGSGYHRNAPQTRSYQYNGLIGGNALLHSYGYEDDAETHLVYTFAWKNGMCCHFIDGVPLTPGGVAIKQGSTSRIGSPNGSSAARSLFMDLMQASARPVDAMRYLHVGYNIQGGPRLGFTYPRYANADLHIKSIIVGSRAPTFSAPPRLLSRIITHGDSYPASFSGGDESSYAMQRNQQWQRSRWMHSFQLPAMAQGWMLPAAISANAGGGTFFEQTLVAAGNKPDSLYDGSRYYQNNLATKLADYSPSLVLMHGGHNDVRFMADGSVTQSGAPLTAAQYQTTIRAHIDAILRSKGQPSIAMVGYQGSPANNFATTAILDSMAAVWAAIPDWVDSSMPAKYSGRVKYRDPRDAYYARYPEACDASKNVRYGFTHPWFEQAGAGQPVGLGTHPHQGEGGAALHVVSDMWWDMAVEFVNGT